MLAAIARPAEVTAAEPCTIEQERGRPFEFDRLVRRAGGADCIGQGRHRRKEGAPRRDERFLGLQDDGKLHEIEAPHPNQRPRSRLRGHTASVLKGVLALAQDY